MARAVAVVVAVLLTASLGVTGAMAQMKTDPAQPKMEQKSDRMGQKVEGTFRAHQVPVDHMENPEHVRVLESWMKSYRPETLFDEQGRLRRELAALAPSGDRRMGANPHANGGRLLRDLVMPDFRDYAVPVERPAVESSSATGVPRGGAAARLRSPATAALAIAEDWVMSLLS